MIPNAPENKSVASPPKPTASPEAVRKAQADFDAVSKATTATLVDPTKPKAIGHGQCPRCRVSGTIFAVGEGRKLVYEGCKCPKR